MMHLALLADAVLVLYLGLRDLRYFGFTVAELIAGVCGGVAVLALATWTALSRSTASAVLLLAVTAALLLHYAVLALRKSIGYGDVVVYLRLPLTSALLLLRDEWFTCSLVAAVTMLLALIAYYRISLRPILCEPRFFGVQLVKREHFTRDNVYPLGVNAEELSPEELANLKERILRETDKECLEAWVGYPLVFLFALSYLSAVLTALTLEYLT
ncbi:MAG: hypothetical protein QXM08_03065 [Thermofilaceae archaeon]